MQITGRNISRVIKKRTGLNIKLFKGGGCFHFYSDDEDTALMLASFHTTTVYTYLLTNFSVDRWVGEFVDMLKKYHDEKLSTEEKLHLSKMFKVVENKF